jgi:hypothetical protein
MRIGWLRTAGKSMFKKSMMRLDEFVQSVFINVNNIHIDDTIFNEYLQYEDTIKELKADPLFDCKSFQTYFIFCMNSFMNKSITIKSPFGNEIITTNEYFILNEDTGGLFPRSICNYYFRKENVILGMSLGVAGNSDKSGCGPMHLGVQYAINLRDKLILECLNTQYELNENSLYFNQLINAVKNYRVIQTPPKSTTITGFQTNIGHNMINSMTGLFLMDIFNVIKYIDNIIIGPLDIFDSKYIYEKYTTNISHKHSLDEYNGVWNKGVVLSYYHFFLSSKFNSYIRTHFNSSMTKNENRLHIDDTLNNVHSIRNTYYPIINIVLRVEKDYLPSQSRVISSIINKLVIDYPNAFILLDGLCNYSTKDANLNLPADLNGHTLAELHMSYNNLVKDISNNITSQKYKSLIGLPYYEILHYTDIATACLYQTSSGTTIAEFISRKNGIHFGRRNGQIFIAMEKIIIEQYPNTKYIDDKYCSYDNNKLSNIDTDVILKELYSHC